MLNSYTPEQWGKSSVQALGLNKTNLKTVGGNITWAGLPGSQKRRQ